MQRCLGFFLALGLVRKEQEGEIRASGDAFATDEVLACEEVHGDSCVLLCDVPELSIHMLDWVPHLTEYCRGKRMFVMDPGLGTNNASALFVSQTYKNPEDVPIETRDFPTKGVQFEYWSELEVSSYISVPIVANSTISEAVLRRAGVGDPTLILDSGCPGTFAHMNVIKENIFYEQMAALMGPSTVFMMKEQNALTGAIAVTTKSKADLLRMRDAAG